MKELQPEELERFAGEYGVPPVWAQRDYVACRVAHAIACDGRLHDAVAFKGGFILRYAYGSLRTSKDIDTTIGRRSETVDAHQMRRLIRGRCADLRLQFPGTPPHQGVDSLDLGTIAYAGPLGPGTLLLEMSRREDWIEPLAEMIIDRFGIPAFELSCLCPEELIAEKWRCLLQRSPLRFGDPYDLWFLWTDVNERAVGPTWPGIDRELVRSLVPQKISGASMARMQAALDGYRQGWTRERGVSIPETAPGFSEVAAAVTDAARHWTPWH